MNCYYEYINFKNKSLPFILRRGCNMTINTKFPCHWHESVEILYFFKGKATVKIDSETYNTEPCDIICVNSEHMHQIIPVTKQIGYHALIIDAELFYRMNISLHNILFASQIKRCELTQIYRSIIKEDINKASLYRDAEYSLLISLIVSLYRNHSSVISDNNALKNPHYSIVHMAISYIKQNYKNDITTADICNSIGISMNYLCACFKKATNITIKRFINCLRCCDAEFMLKSGNYTVGEVCSACGFNNAAYFAKIYRQIIGCNPSQTICDVKKSEMPVETRIQQKFVTDVQSGNKL